MRRATQAELLQRIHALVALMRDGESTARLYHYCHIMFNVNDRQARKYIAAAREKLAEEARIDRSVYVGKIMARIDQLYARGDSHYDEEFMLKVVKAQLKLLSMLDTAPDAALNAAVERISDLVPADLEGDEATEYDMTDAERNTLSNTIK